MSEKSNAYNEMTKKKFELDNKFSELEAAKDQYIKSIINETLKDILNVLEEKGNIEESLLKLYLESLTTDIKNTYSR